MNDKLKLTALAITPFVIGNLFNFIILSGINALFLIISVLFYLYWFWVGFISNKLTDSTLQSLLIGNSFGIISIIVLLLSGIIFQKYLPGIIGLQLQMYFLPSVNVSSKILSIFTTKITSNGFYGMSFVLMVLVYYIGYIIGRKRT